MKQKYALKIIYYDMYTKKNFQELLDETPPVICYGLDDLWLHCGGKLHRERCGYAARCGNTYFVATRIK